MSHGGKLAARALKQAGVECVFTLCGGHVMAIYDGCIDEGIQVIDVRHEQAAVHAADAWARLNPGKVGVAIVTAGPGVTDGVTGVANAWRANSPILVFGGQGPFAQLRKGSLQEMDHVGLMAPITKYSDACYATKRIPEYVELAIRTALSGVPGPAFLEIPIDILSAPVELDAVTFPRFRDYRVQASAPRTPVEEALAVLRRAERPMVMAGTALKWSEGGPQLTEFAELTNIPVFTNGMGRGLIPMDHPQFFNRSRAVALGQADVVLLAGTPLDFRMKFGRSIPADAKIIQMDLDEVLVGMNRSADIGLVGNLGATFALMMDVMAEKDIKLDFSGYSSVLREKEISEEATLLASLNSDEVPIDPLRLCREIADFVDDEMIVIGDGGDIVAQSSKVVKVPKRGAWMDPGPLGTLGVGMPFALAAQARFPEKRVLIIYGDGSFGLNGFEFDTAVRFNLPIVGIVGNDAAWGQMIRPQSTQYGAERIIATRLNYTRYDKVVEAMGGHGEHVTEPDQIRPALERAFASGKPALVNVEMRQDIGAMKGSTYV
ncbi:MAG: thiamine pyrophosphate-binding protein [Acidimicrobiales bacterium]